MVGVPCGVHSMVLAPALVGVGLFGGNAKGGVVGIMPKGPKILSVGDRGLRSV